MATNSWTTSLSLALGTVLVGVGVLALAGTGSAQTNVRTGPELHMKVPDAEGPPAQSCREALGLLDEPPSRPKVPAPRSYPAPKTEGMARIQLSPENRLPAEIPGQDPSSLPLQAIEGTPEALSALRKLWAQPAGSARLRLSVFGASHTGADYWTGRMRRVLQDRHGDLGHGFILPAALYKGYRGSDINLCRTNGWLSDWVGKRNGHKDGLLGFGGMSVSSSNPHDFGWAETTRSNPHGRKVERIDLFALGQPQGGRVEVQVDTAEPVSFATHRTDTTLVWVRVEVPDGPHRTVLRPKGDGPVRLFGLSLERSGPGALVDAIGIRGRQARTWLEWDEGLFRSGLQALDPDLVVLAYGTNEANRTHLDLGAYREELREVLRRLRRAHPEPAACLLVGPSDRFVRVDDRTYAVWSHTQGVAEVQREVSREFHCGFWDWQQATGGPGSMLAWHLGKPSLASKDGIHHSKAGYERIADRLIAALDKLASP